MARIAGVNIPVQKHTWVGLTHIYGIGKTRAYEICAAAGVAPETKIRDLTEAEEEAISSEDGPRLLPWPAAPPRSAGTWSANEDQRAHP